MWIEATHVSPRNQSERDDLKTFPGWIREGLEARGAVPRMRIDLRKRDDDAELTVPPRNERRRLKQTPAWGEFVEAVTAGRPGTWEPGAGFNVVVKVTQDSLPGSGYPATGIPRRPLDHVVYRSIRSKAKQIRARGDRAGRRQPLIVSICTSHPGTEVNADSFRATRLGNALTAAFCDTRKWDEVALHNFIGPSRERERPIRGSEFISAVLLTEILDPPMPLYGPSFRFAETRLFRNPYARSPLDPSTCEALNELDFNHYSYGPQHGENWSVPLEDPQDQRPRRSQESGSIVWSPKGVFNMSLELPTDVLLRVLSGEGSVEEAMGQSAPKGAIEALKIAFRCGCEIESIDKVDAVPAQRKPQRVKFQFGPPRPPVVAVKKQENDEKSRTGMLRAFQSLAMALRRWRRP
ncbi:MAG: hypothetical protein GY937_09240 [bacterium]|nr:hypothetical protein [bacterium]